MIKAILWDHDGTMIESEALYREVAIKICKKYGIDLSKKFIEKYSALAMKDYFQTIIHHHNLKITIEDMLKTHQEIFDRRDIRLTAYVKETLDKLKPLYKMGVVSNANRDWLDYIFQTHGLKNYFEVVVAIEDVLEGKPFPEPYLKGAELLKLKSENIVVIEDSTAGFQAAKGAGMKVIARKSPFNRGQDFSLADFITEDLREIPKIIKNLVQ